ncbi:hypothetical protein GWK76_03905 [Candidatus Saccharibacteria bacterium oral taxon 488]|jgi:hypothetical protein|nr:hypothetical protein GWK76_03905 [Candidatus Saccharibacteria bacterium oral taxon 488]
MYRAIRATEYSVKETLLSGYIVTNLKTTREARVGDTVTLKKYMTKE